MGLETGVNYIADLVNTNPAVGDVVSQGDDHLRNIKRALQASFPKMGGVMNDTVAGTGSTVTISSTISGRVYANNYTGSAAATIPAAATVGKGFVLTLMNTSYNATDYLTASLSGADTFPDGNTSLLMYRGVTAQFVSDGVSKWFTICGDIDFWKVFYRNLADTALQKGLHSIWLPIKDATTPGTGAPALGQTTGSNGMVVDHYAFDQSAVESLQWTFMLPVAYLQLGPLAGKFHVELFWHASSGTGSVVWGVAATIPSFGIAWDIAYGTELTVASDPVTAYFMQRAKVNNLVPNTSGIYNNTGKEVNLRVRRMATDGSDTTPADALLTGVQVYFETDRVNESAYS